MATVRSKTKSRQSVEFCRVDMDTRSMQWSNECYTLKQFYEQHLHQFPLLLQVTDGYDGIDGWHAFSSGDVFWITDIYKQPRILLKDSLGRNISFCRDFPGLFHIVDSSKGKAGSKPLTLEKVTQRWLKAAGPKKDFEIALQDNKEVKMLVGLSEQTFSSLGIVRIVDIYDELSLVARPILRGDTMCQQACLIPLYVNIKVAVCRGLGGRSTAGELEKLKETLQQLTAFHHQSELHAPNDIIVFNNIVMEGDYGYIMPDQYGTLPVGVKTPVVQFNISQSGASSDDDSTSSNNKPPHPPPLPKRPAIKLPPPERQPDDAPELTTTHKPSPPILPPKPNRPTTILSTSTPQHSKLANQYEMDLSYPTKPIRTLPIKTSNQNKPSIISSKPTANKEDANQAPTPTGQGSADDQLKKTDSDEGVYVNLADVPIKVDGMSCTQLASAVSLLFPRHPEYAKQLLEMEIDGVIVRSLDQDIIASELGFTKIDAIKMVRFVANGWKPVRADNSTVSAYI